MGVVFLYPVAIKNRKVLHPPFERRQEMKPNKTSEILTFFKSQFINKYITLNSKKFLNHSDTFSGIYEKETSKCVTPIEKIMGGILLNVEDIDFNTQQELGKYKVDFFVYVIRGPKSKEFIIECDGHDFHEKTKEQAKHDKERDRFLQSLGYPVYRFTGSEIYNNPLSIMFEIKDIVNKYLEELKLEDSRDE